MAQTSLPAAVAALNPPPMLDVDQLDSLAQGLRSGLHQVRAHVPIHLADAMAPGLEQLRLNIDSLEALALEFKGGPAATTSIE